MLKDSKFVQYSITVLKTMASMSGEQDACEICRAINSNKASQVSPSYLSKVLARMVKCKMLISTNSGYRLAIPLEDITLSMILEMPEVMIDDPLKPIYDQVKKSTSDVKIIEII